VLVGWAVRSAFRFIRFFFFIDSKLLAMANRKRILQAKLIQSFKSAYPLPSSLLPLRLQILSASASEIAKKITKDREWTAEQVVLVYCHEAISVHEELNCLTEIMFEEALEMASKIDAEFKKSGKPIGSLHGVKL